MVGRHVRTWVAFGGALLAVGLGAAHAQGFPSRPIRIVCAPIGSGADVASRLIAQAITGPLGQSVVVENRPAGVIPGQVVAQSGADGHTLLYSGSSFWLGPYLRSSTPYDPARDFYPVVQTVRQPALLVVPAALPVSSVKELIAYARAKPGELNYASSALGSLNHLGAELFQAMSSTKLQRIDYKGGAQAVQDLIGGRVQIMFGTTSLLTPQVKSGKLKSLAVTSAQPTELAPGVPTLATSGVPGYEAVSNAGIFVPAKTPRPVVQRLHQEIVRALARPDVKERFFATGADVVGGSSEQFAATIRQEMLTMGKMIKERGLRED